MSRASDRAEKLLAGLVPLSVASTPAISSHRGVLGRLEKLTGQKLVIQDVDPQRVRVWALQGRIQDELDERSCADLIESLRVHPQTTPAIVRPVKGDPDADFEVIDGSRRRFATAHLGKLLTVIVADLSDRDAALLTETADASRKHSSYEAGRKWRAWLDCGLFDSQATLGAFIGVPPASLSFSLALAELPYPFAVAVGGHERLSRDLGKRLARFVGRARALGELDARRQELQKLGELAREQGWTPVQAIEAYRKLEQVLLPPRLVPDKVETTIPDTVGRPAGVLASPDKFNFTLKWSKALGLADRRELVTALGSFLAEWTAKRSSDAEDARSPLSKKKKA